MISRLFNRNDDDATESDKDETRATDAPAVTMYTTSWCGSCAMAKRYLKDKGVAYEEIDIEQTPEAATIVMGLARGNKTVPTFLIGETVIVDWDRKAVATALADAGLI